MRLIHPGILAALLACALSIQAKTITVPKDAPRIQAGLDKAEPSDTVLVLNGFYSESIVLKDRVVLMGESVSGTVIHGNGRKPVVTGADQAVISKFTIENGSIGIRCENNSTVIENCLIRSNKGSGIQCLISLPAIRNCVIVRNGWTGLFLESSRSIKTAVEHCIFAENGYCGINLSGRSEVLISHNVFFKNKEYGIWAGEESRKSRITFNNFFGNRLPNNFFATVDNSNTDTDPGFTVSNSNLYDYGQTENLKGKGKDGISIGLISEADLMTSNDDSDRDGVKNDKDACPDVAEDIDGFEDEDGCPDFDNDKDSYYDTQDNCPDQAEDYDGFRDEDGCPDDDNDKDGVLDQSDICPQNKEVVNGYKDDDGCPDEVPADHK